MQYFTKIHRLKTRDNVLVLEIVFNFNLIKHLKINILEAYIFIIKKIKQFQTQISLSKIELSKTVNSSSSS